MTATSRSSPRARRTFTHIKRVGRYRSKMEADYAAHLEWLRLRGLLLSWEYEPMTFWFDKPRCKGRGVRRGVTSYKPDFLIQWPDGKAVFIEVKGYMDAKSKTKLKRMAIYYPEVNVRVVDNAGMRIIRKNSGARFAP